MATKIEWTDETWNPITGCSPVSPGCDSCYAKRMSIRLAGRYGYPAKGPFRPTFHPERLDHPHRWKKSRRIFVCSMGDLFHDAVTGSQLDQIFSVMRQAPHHIFLVLTKRPAGMREYIEGRYGRHPLPNVWLGVTAEDQQRADERIPVLLETPAVRRFVSIEPMLGPVSLPAVWMHRMDHRTHVIKNDTILDWVIIGGETGPGARPMHPDWVRSVRDQCQMAGTPFFFKQWGEWAPDDCWGLTPEKKLHRFPEGVVMNRFGKKIAGHDLYGRHWRELPK